MAKFNPPAKSSADGKSHTISGNITTAEVTANQSGFTDKVVVLSFNSVSSPGVSYTVPGALTGIDVNGLNRTITIPATASIPSGQYNLTVQLGNQIIQIPVNVG